MSNQASIKLLAAKVAGLREAMEAVLHTTTPDHGKWTGANAFVSKYSQLARHYIALTGDNSINVYDVSKLTRAVWPQQKE